MHDVPTMPLTGRKAPGVPQARAFRVELPTLGVAVAIFGGFLALTWYFQRLPLWFAASSGSLLLAWYGSFQHETIHGHPTSSRRVNSLLGGLPLALWIPYSIYRQTHLWHHRHGGRYLTDPIQDPESFYPRPRASSMGIVRRIFYRANCTLLGRLTIGPTITVGRFLSGEVRQMRAGNLRLAGIWLRHAAAAGLVLGWVVGVCRIPLLTYVACVVYPSVSLTLLRSFAEHRADEDPNLRTAVVEGNPLLALLFLNNNLHIAHHAEPKVPWYGLPEVWRRLQASPLGVRAQEAGLVHRGGYATLILRYLWRPVIRVEHPLAGARGG